MSEATKREALDRIDRLADDEWRKDVAKIIKSLARSQPSLTIDDVWEAGAPKPPNKRPLSYIGIAMLDAARRGWIESTSARYMSEKANHSGVTVWRSLIGPDGPDPRIGYTPEELLRELLGYDTNDKFVRSIQKRARKALT